MRTYSLEMQKEAAFGGRAAANKKFDMMNACWAHPCMIKAKFNIIVLKD